MPQGLLVKTTEPNGAKIGVALPIRPPAPVARRRGTSSGLVILITLLICAMLAGTSVLAFHAADRYLTQPPPGLPPAPPPWLVRDLTPVPLTITEYWQKIPIVVTADQVLTDPILWRRMHFGDWDTVGYPLREVGLSRLIDRHRLLLAGPGIWRTMSPHDWDRVPQPIRAMAFIRMIEYWSARYQVGARHTIPRRLITDTMAAIMMVESWFEHRAVQVNPRGDRDLGLAQASEFLRETMIRLYLDGWLDFELAEEDYFNPWHASRVVVMWFNLMLREARGNLDLAVRAYYRGISAARAGEAEEYLENVKQKRRRYIRNQIGSPAWSYLFERLCRPTRAAN